jgi:hypothetical protein
VISLPGVVPTVLSRAASPQQLGSNLPRTLPATGYAESRQDMIQIIADVKVQGKAELYEKIDAAIANARENPTLDRRTFS